MEKIQRKKLFTGFSTVGRQIYETRLYDIELVKRDLMNHFMTKKGERVMKPNFGSNIWNLLFEPFTESIKQQVMADVTTIINAEPRVKIVSMYVEESEYGIGVTVQLNYTPYDVVDKLYIEYVRNNFKTDSFGLDRYIEDIES